MATQSKKSWSVTVKRRSQQFIAVLVVIWLIAFLLTFQKVAEAVSKGLAKMGINVPADKIRNTAVAITFGATGSLLIQAAITFSAVPFFGIGLAVVGAGFLIAGAITSYNIFKKDDQPKITEPLR